MANFMQLLMQEAERAKRNLKAAPGRVADQVSNFSSDWKGKDLTKAVKSEQLKPEQFKAAIEEVAGNSLPGGAGAKLATVFHGSGRVFEATPANKLGEFMKKYIGSGEGNAAFGHGTAYVADSKDVADNYYKSLSKAVADKSLVDSYVNRADDITGNRQLGSRLYALGTTGSLKANDTVIASMLKHVKAADKETNWYSSLAPAQKKEVEALLADIQRYPMVTPSGALYKAELNDEALIKAANWDAPIAEQSKLVLDAISEIAGKNEKGNLTPFGKRYRELAADKSEQFTLPPSASFNKAQQALSEQLEQLGVRGISYLDGSSRRIPGATTKNHVVFNPADLTILERLK